MIYWLRSPKAASGSGEYLKRALCDYLTRVRGMKISAQQIPVSRSPAGRPYLSRDFGTEFSVTHTANWWICAVGASQDGPVGLDAEEKERHVRRTEALAGRFFSEQEAEILAGLPEKEAEQIFLRMWVRKESYLKYTGTGLAGGMNTFSTAERDEDDAVRFRRSIFPQGGRAGGEAEFTEVNLSEELYVVLCRRAGVKDRETEIWKLM